MKLRNLCFAALAALAFTACESNDDPINGKNDQLKGDETHMNVTVTTVSNLKAHYGDLGVTAPEAKVTELKLYIFKGSDANSELEKIVDMGPSDLVTATGENDVYKKVVMTSTGTKTFLVAANLSYYTGGGYPPILSSDNLGTARQKMLNIAAIGDAATNDQFWMTSTGDVAMTLTDIVDEAGATAGLNNVEIKMGRAVAKVGVYFNPTNPASTTDGSGKLDNVFFKMGNNPKKMMMFTSNYENTQYRWTPYYLINSERELTPAINTTDYFKNPDTDYRAATVNTANPPRFNHPYYMVENSNKVPKKGNATFAYLKGTFLPSTVFQPDGVTPSTSFLAGTFWRSYNPETKKYGTKFFDNAPTEAAIKADLGISTLPAGATGWDKCTAKYENGVAYYAYYLKNTSETGYVNQYTVKRNNYWSIVITSVNGCGENTEDKVDPGHPDGPDPDDPLVDETYVNAVVEVVNWEGIEQTAEI